MKIDCHFFDLLMEKVKEQKPVINALKRKRKNILVCSMDFIYIYGKQLICAVSYMELRIGISYSKIGV